MKRARVALLVLVVAIVGTGQDATSPAPLEAAEKAERAAPSLGHVAELNRLYARWKTHCDKAFVTAEVLRLYELAVREMDEAGYGYGRDSNFVGVKPPRTAWVECAENGG